MENKTFAHQFILIGLSTNPYIQPLLFIILLLMYIVTVLGNSLIIIIVRLVTQLQTPMYFFLSNLSLIDLCFSTTIVPKLLINTLSKDKSISFLGCAAQMYFHLALGGTECIILAIMAYDRYIAICKPLLYYTIMNMRLCVILSAITWIFNFLNSIFYAFITFQLPYCRSNHVNHYFCEMPPLLRLSCKDTLWNEIAVYISGAVVGFCAFMLTLLSYVQIISTISKMHSTKGRKKAFSTCTSHLCVVSLYYGTIVFMYLRPRGSYSVKRDRIVSILYTVVTPMVNPIIYSIRNNEVKVTLKKILQQRKNTRL
ncbi:PREDICTED: olfactory receptor-like protein OLF3 [Nanorana parkeri]|uniref:olfactory receptor-like protein OLF3 n=1 Tax=Nanorana parkeri TaxID=125878 RepID=UPI000854C131|nr:PREDICTED: olfactory receptor-like protein OLF3 [Nanorana parkeri]